MAPDIKAKRTGEMSATAAELYTFHQTGVRGASGHCRQHQGRHGRSRSAQWCTAGWFQLLQQPSDPAAISTSSSSTVAAW